MSSFSFFSSRDRAFLFFLVFLFFILIAQLFNLQIIQYIKYYKEADKNRIRMVYIDAPRGLIYDRYGRIIAGNKNTFTVAITPYRIKNRTHTIKKICEILDLDTNKTLTYAKPKFSFKPIPLKRDIDFKKVSILSEHKDELPGINIIRSLMRYYPYDTVGCHFLGYLNEIKEDELENLKENGYNFGDLIGRSGVEAQYEKLLRGEDGYKYIEVNALEREMGEIYKDKTKEPVPGNNLVLTVDMELQKYAEELLSKYKAGSIVMLDVKTGDVLVLANYPVYSLNLLSRKISSEDWNKIMSNPNYPMFNRAINSKYPPGSVFKVVVAAAAMELLGIDLNTHLQPCKGYMEYGDRIFGCWKSSGHGDIDLRQAIVQSCDVYFYQLGLKLGINNIHDWALKFNLGKQTGIDLRGENAGLIPTKEFYTEKLGWSHFPKGVLLNLSIGQGEILVTPLQMAFLMALIANEGECSRPHLLKYWYNPLKKEELHFYKSDKVIIDVLPSVLVKIKKSLRDAVNGHFATGYRAKVKGVTVAGKTGSAEVIKKEHYTHAWFAGFAPYDDPEVAFACIVEFAGHGGSVAAPIIGDLLHYYFYKEKRIDNNGIMKKKRIGDESD